MAKLLKLRRGTNTQHTTFTGAEGEVTVNTTNDSLHVHDGATAGGTELAKADLSNVDGSLSNNLGFADNTKALFGTGNDLEIFHDGTNSYIKDVGTGDLGILADNNVFIQNAAGTENKAKFYSNGAVELYYDNAQKLATTSGGINVTGTVTCDGLTCDGAATIAAGTGELILKDSDTLGSGTGITAVIRGAASDGAFRWWVGDTSASNSNLEVYNQQNGAIIFGTNNTDRCIIDASGHFLPSANNASDLGTSSNQWRNAYIDGTVNCDGLTSEGEVTINANEGILHLQDNNSTGNGNVNYIDGRDSANSVRWYLGHASGSNQDLYVSNNAAGQITFRTASTERAVFDANGHFRPWDNNTYDLGTSSLRWRNVYTNDLNLSNEGGANDVDGTWGNWTIQEGEDDLFLLNRRNGKKYKFNLSEVN